MKIKGKDLVKFIKKVSLHGTGNSIDNIKFNFKEHGLTCVSINASNITMVEGTLLKEAFVEYEALGEVVLQNIDRVVKIISGFDDVLELKFEGNLLTLVMGKRKIETELMSPDVYKGADKLPDLNKDNAQMFSFDIGVLKQIIADMSINQDFNIFLETYSNGLQVRNDGTFKFTERYDLDVPLGEAKVKFADPLIHAIKNLEGSVKFTLKSNYPLFISEESEHCKIDVITAPRVEQD